MQFSRRGFFGFLAAGIVATAASTRLGQFSLNLVDQPLSIVELISKRIAEATQTMQEQIAQHIYGGYSKLEVHADPLLQATEWEYR